MKRATPEQLAHVVSRTGFHLSELARYQPELVPTLLIKLMKTSSPLVGKDQLKKLYEVTPWCVVTMKCLCQIYS